MWQVCARGRTRGSAGQRETHRSQHRQQPRQELRLQQRHGGRRRGGGDVGEGAEDARRGERAGLAVLEQRVRHRRRLDVGALGEDEEELRRRSTGSACCVARSCDTPHSRSDAASASPRPAAFRAIAVAARSTHARCAAAARRRAEQLDRRREDGVGRGGGELDERGLDRAAHVGEASAAARRAATEVMGVLVRGGRAQNQGESRCLLWQSRSPGNLADISKMWRRDVSQLRLLLVDERAKLLGERHVALDLHLAAHERLHAVQLAG